MGGRGWCLDTSAALMQVVVILACVPLKRFISLTHTHGKRPKWSRNNDIISSCATAQAAPHKVTRDRRRRVGEWERG